MLLDHRPRVIDEVICQIVQCASSGEFLADLGRRRVGRVSPRTAKPRQRPVASIEMDDHLTVVLILSCFECELPGMRLECFHMSIVDRILEPRVGENVIVFHGGERGEEEIPGQRYPAGRRVPDLHRA